MERSWVIAVAIPIVLAVVGFGALLWVPDSGFYLQAVLISFGFGFLAALPFGPAGIMALETALTRGFAIAIFAGLGAAVSDAVHATLIIYGITGLMQSYEAFRIIVPLVGSTLIAAYGVLSIVQGRRHHVKILEHGVEEAIHMGHRMSGGAGRSFLRGFAIAFLNPGNFLFFISAGSAYVVIKQEALVSGFHLNYPFIYGIFWGCLTLFTVTVYLGSHGKNLIPKHREPLIRIVSGVVMLGLAAFILVYYFWSGPAE